MSVLDFYAVVKVLPHRDTKRLGVVGKTGVVVGRSHDESGDSYAVLIDEETYMIGGSALVATGDVLSRGSIYSGESTIVYPERYGDEGDTRS